MGSRRQGVREGIPNVNYEREQETFMATMNDVAEVVREAAVGAARAVERLGVRDGNKNEYGEDNVNDENNLGHPERPMTLATFLKVNPPKFKGTLVATDADNWFRGIERSLRAQHVPEGQHVEFATYMPEGEAEYWWQGIQRLLQQNENNIPWDIFRDKFYKKYFPGAARDAKEMELMQLRQGDMTVAEYARKFDDLCRFSKICQGNPADFEEWKCLKFEGGLREELMNSVVPLEIRNFAELVNKSKLVEECSKKLATARASRREDLQRDFVQNLAPQGRNFKAIGQFQHWNGNHRAVSLLTCNNGSDNNRDIRQGHESQPHQAQNGVICPTCGKNHGSRLCRVRTGLCYYCNKEGHWAIDCRKRMVDESAGNIIKFGSIARGKFYAKNLLKSDIIATFYLRLKF
ncbi:uncharacterized protein LOC130980925 [Arachis stenosperma]|uniref:uncharacterized protein LOC130980925 n=1 Tax=Arachis stenosperma TaxID=217475 RepID=UPI0025AC9DDA|nr:uncharacterized protein LOC130980925 [Arachis stenosperma]